MGYILSTNKPGVRHRGRWTNDSMDGALFTSDFTLVVDILIWEMGPGFVLTSLESVRARSTYVQMA